MQPTAQRIRHNRAKCPQQCQRRSCKRVAKDQHQKHQSLHSEPVRAQTAQQGRQAACRRRQWSAKQLHSVHQHNATGKANGHKHEDIKVQQVGPKRHSSSNGRTPMDPATNHLSMCAAQSLSRLRRKAFQHCSIILVINTPICIYKLAD